MSLCRPIWDPTPGGTGSSPSAKCDLYRRSYHYRVCTTGLYIQILMPLIKHQVLEHKIGGFYQQIY